MPRCSVLYHMVMDQFSINVYERSRMFWEKHVVEPVVSHSITMAAKPTNVRDLKQTFLFLVFLILPIDRPAIKKTQSDILFDYITNTHVKLEAVLVNWLGAASVIRWWVCYYDNSVVANVQSFISHHQARGYVRRVNGTPAARPPLKEQPKKT